MLQSFFIFGKKEKIAFVILVMLLFILPICLKKNIFLLHLLITILVYSSIGISWNILGSAGVVSLGHTFFYGIGAYISSCLLIFYGINPWIGMIIAMVINLLIGVLIGNMFIKLSGHYFAIATIALAEIGRIIVINWEKIGGSVGLFIPYTYKDSLINFQFPANKLAYYYIILMFFILFFIFSNYLLKTRFGYYLRAIKGNSEAAQSLGINIIKIKVIAVSVGAVIMSMMGTFMAQYVLYISPETFFVFNISLYALLVVVVGGLGNTWGPLIGSFLLVVLSEFFRIYIGGTGRAVDLVIYGLIIMIIAIYQPTGIIGLLGRFKKIN